MESCSDCPFPPVAWARAALLYEGPARGALMRLKFGGLRSLAAALAPSMAGRLESDAAQTIVGRTGWVVTWVPLGTRRRRRRGFDQAEALARPVGNLLGLPVRRVLRRAIETGPQARRSGAERRVALRGAFEAVGQIPERVLLVDDVLTSGATAAACAEALTSAGAREVGVVAAARSLGGPIPARCYTRDGSGPGLWLPEGGSFGSRCQPQAKRPT